MGKRQLYTKGGTIDKTIPEHRILKTENNIQNIKAILKHIIKLYLPIEREFTNDSSARHSTVQYMVLAVFDG
jgi:hypothetical protein